MQSDYLRYCEYEIGRQVWDGDYLIGRVEAMVPHRERKFGYLLVRNAKRDYTIYMCMVDARGGLSLTRHIPSYVMEEFATVILRGHAMPIEAPTPPKVNKYPVISDPEPEEAEPEEAEPEEVAGCLKSPYFSFI